MFGRFKSRLRRLAALYPQSEVHGPDPWAAYLAAKLEAARRDRKKEFCPVCGGLVKSETII